MQYRYIDLTVREKEVGRERETGEDKEAHNSFFGSLEVECFDVCCVIWCVVVLDPSVSLERIRRGRKRGQLLLRGTTTAKWGML